MSEMNASGGETDEGTATTAKSKYNAIKLCTVKLHHYEKAKLLVRCFNRLACGNGRHYSDQLRWTDRSGYCSGVAKNQLQVCFALLHCPGNRSVEW